MSLFKFFFHRCAITRKISLLDSNAQSYNFLSQPSRTLASSPQIDVQQDLGTEDGERKKKNLKPLDIVFKEVMGLIPRTDSCGDGTDGEGNELQRKLKELERELRDLRSQNPLEVGTTNLRTVKKDLFGINAKSVKSLVKLFAEDGKREKPKEEPLLFKELSKDMKMLVKYLLKEGYFRNANFMKGKNSDFRYFEMSYGRDFLKFAAVKFGEDHQDIAKWLSGSDLKKLALFGCPSVAKSNVYAAKRLRAFFELQEDIVCRDCTLKHTCKFANKPVWRAQEQNLKLSDVMKLITSYDLVSDPPELVVPDKIGDSLSRLLREILKLCTSPSIASMD